MGLGETEQIKKFAFVNAYLASVVLISPFVMITLTLVVYFKGGGSFSPDVIFTAISLFLIIRFPLMVLPMTISGWIQGKVHTPSALQREAQRGVGGGWEG